MYSKGKQQQPQQQQQMVPPQQPLPAEIQAKEKLALYVYEYLVHIGAKNSAQTFLTELQWNKPIPMGDPPGFLSSWWCVFWDLYCAATPDRRDQFEPSNEAKAFHDYTNNGIMVQQQQPPAPPPPDPSQMQQPNQMMNPNNSFFAAPTAQNTMMNSGQPQFQRYHSGGQRPVRMPSNMDFNPGVNNPNQMNPDQSRVPAGMSPLSRLTPPGNRMPPGMQQQQQPPQQQVPPGVNPMVFNGQQQQQGPPNNPQQVMRGPPMPQQQQQQPPQQPNQVPTPGTPMSPSMSFQQQQQQQQQQQRWNPQAAAVGQQQQNPQQQPGQQQQQQAQQQQVLQPPQQPPPHNMNFPSASPPIAYANVQMSGHPGTPGIIPSPQDANGDINFNNIMKNVPGGMQYHEQNMAHMVSINPDVAHHSHLNNEIIDSMKHSPIQNMQAGVRHPDDHSSAGSINDLNSYNHFGDGGVGLF